MPNMGSTIKGEFTDVNQMNVHNVKPMDGSPIQQIHISGFTIIEKRENGKKNYGGVNNILSDQSPDCKASSHDSSMLNNYLHITILKPS